jgi:DNA-binding transcriptional LysR family regulator
MHGATVTTPLPWSDLQVFLAVCERGSVGAAARALDVNHSTVLRRLGALEARLAVRLFDRFPRGYALTADGHALAASLAGVSDQLDAAPRHVGQGDLALRGTIRVTAPDTLMQLFLIPLVAPFHALHPELRLELVAGDAFLNLTQREADVALRGANHPPENLIGRPVGTIRSAVYASRALLDAAGSRDPRALRWVGHEASLAHLASARWVARHVPDDRIVLRVGSLVAMAQAVANGVGAGWLLCPFGDADDRLDRLLEPLPELDTRVWVLTHPDLRRVARIRALTDFLVERLSGDPRLVHAP